MTDHPDALLLRLGKTRSPRSPETVQRMVDTRARTLDGVAAKLAEIRWAVNNDIYWIEEHSDLLDSIAADIEAMKAEA